MMLLVDFCYSFGALNFEASFESAGHLTALFGLSGSGKTSLINTIVGLIRPDAGRIVIGDRTLVDTAARKFAPAYKRRVDFVF